MKQARGALLYAGYQLHRALFDPVRGVAGVGVAAAAALPRPLGASAPVRAVAGSPRWCPARA